LRAFAQLYDALDRTRSTNAKVAAMASWFDTADPEDAAWAVSLLIGRRARRTLKMRTLTDWTCEQTGMPGWLFSECYSAVGDLAEVMALLLEDKGTVDAPRLPLHRWMTERILPVAKLKESEQRQQVASWWSELETRERFLLVKIVTGAFRVGVSQTLVTRALAEHADLPASLIAARLMGNWEPSRTFFEALIAPDSGTADPSQPYPYFLAHPLADDVESLGEPDEWQLEWKWDGIRGQLIRRDGQTFLWTRGEELVTERFPEIVALAEHLPDGTVLDGEVLGWAEDEPLPFSALQTRIGRKKPGAKTLKDCPVRFMAYDLLEHGGEDIRALPLTQRRRHLEEVVAQTPGMLLSQIVTGSWTELRELRLSARDRRVEGFMLKRRDSVYRAGRPKGDWWKWKIDPLVIDAVMIYAQKGHGRRASRFTDYTFGLWKGEELVSVAKAYTGLTNDEIDELDKWIRSHTIERFGPVRHVTAEHVFELHFDNVRHSKRHKSGVAVRFPRIGRWRRDKRPADADQLATLEAMIQLE